MNSDAVAKDGEWYRLFSAALLHADAFHLLLNGVALGLAGFLLESLVGPAWLLSLFLLGAAGGSLMGLVVNPASIVSVGASGAVMGLLAAAVILAMRFPPGLQRTQIQARLLQFLIPSLIPLATYRQKVVSTSPPTSEERWSGSALGFALLAIWPKSDKEPRFPLLAKGLGVMTLLVFGTSVALARGHYGAHAADAAFSAADLLVDDSRIPDDPKAKTRDVDSWGKGYSRDPRVHLFRALRLIGEENEVTAEAELRAALHEREILDRAFSNKKLEIVIRSVLCEMLVRQGKRDAALLEATPVCKANNGAAPKDLKDLGLCN